MKTFKFIALSLFISSAIASSFSSCSSNSPTSNEECDSTVTEEVDSIDYSKYNFEVDTTNNGNIDTIPTTKHPSRKYYDAIAFNLNGHVKELITVWDDTTEYVSETFNIDGSLVINYDYTNIIRDENNRLVAIENNYTAEKKNGKTVIEKITHTKKRYFTWKNGLVIADEESAHEECITINKSNPSGYVSFDGFYYEYNKEGQVIKEYWSNGGNKAEYYIYEYLDFDSHGNWTKRNTIYKYNDQIESFIESRKITYYE